MCVDPTDECCISVHVSALLDHWLDWDRPLMSKPEVPKDSTYIAKLMSHLATLQDPVPRVRDFCSNLGCDSLNRPDNTGRTLLHHLLSGRTFFLFLNALAGLGSKLLSLIFRKT